MALRQTDSSQEKEAEYADTVLDSYDDLRYQTMECAVCVIDTLKWNMADVESKLSLNMQRRILLEASYFKHDNP